MAINTPHPRVLLISQWPNTKNGEYELIEKIRQTHYKISVVDILGFDVDTGECLNHPKVSHEFDFAISFHYDTPKFINIPTFLWIANPLEFMYLRGDYRTVILHNLRAYDGFLFNGAELLATQIRNVIGSEWVDPKLEMYPSCSVTALIPPKCSNQPTPEFTDKIFYCGVNWEKGMDQKGRGQGLLEILQEKQIADFYGPNKLEHISPWKDFISYKGEIPFDGVSMNRVIQKYGAVLAISSPAHLKSRTSSSRVFEGIAAGVPVISDENDHVKKHFGDLVYYFTGNTEEEKANSIATILQHINDDPEDARQRVLKAQELMSNRYCFETCFNNVLKVRHEEQRLRQNPLRTLPKSIDVFLFDHDQISPSIDSHFDNAQHLLEAIVNVVHSRGVRVRIVSVGKCSPEFNDAIPEEVIWKHYIPENITDRPWDQVLLGEKVAILAKWAEAEQVVFLTQFDFLHYDYFVKAIDWFRERVPVDQAGLYIAGSFVADLAKKTSIDTVSIIKNNQSNGLYRWSQNSLAEHQLAMLCFNRQALKLLAYEKIARFDIVLPVSIIIDAMTQSITLHRSRYFLLRVQHSYFHRHQDMLQRADERGFWAQHYDLVTNYSHELNALYDVHHESTMAIKTVDSVSGHSLPSMSQIDSAIHRVNRFINRLRPIYRWGKKVRSIFRMRKTA